MGWIVENNTLDTTSVTAHRQTSFYMQSSFIPSKYNISILLNRELTSTTLNPYITVN